MLRHPILATSSFILIATIAFSANATSESNSISTEDGRYQLEQTDTGFIRLDRQTGSVSVCSLKEDVLACRLGADERAAYEESIDTMQEKLDALERRIVALEAGEDRQVTDDQSAGDQAATPDPESKSGNPDQLKQDLDRAMEFAKDAMSRFMTVIEELKQEYRNNAEPKT